TLFFHELNRWNVPWRSEGVKALGSCVGDEFLVLGLVELDAVAVVQVGHVAPWGGADLVAHVHRGGDLRGALLELHCVGAGSSRNVDQLLGNFDVAIVVDADLADDVDLLACAEQRFADCNWLDVSSHGGHGYCLSVGETWGNFGS